MLIISGTAECISANKPYNKDERHIITMFSTDETLENNLDAIEKNLNSLGWDKIVIEEVESVEDSTALNHPVLKEGFEKASNVGLAFVVNNEALEEIAAA